MANRNSRTQHTLAIYARALREARPYWPLLALVLLVGLIGIPLALLAPLPLKLMVDNVLGAEPLPAWLDWLPAAWHSSPDAMFFVVVGIALAVGLGAVAHQIGDWLLREYVGERMTLDFRAKLLGRGLRASLLKQEAGGAHDTAYRINMDAPGIQWTALYGPLPVVVSLATLAGFLYVTFLIAPALAVIALATSVPLLILIHLSQTRIRDRWRDVKEHETAAQSIVQETMSALRVVTLFNRDRHERSRYMRRAGQGVRARLGVIRHESLYGLAMGVTTAVGTVAVLYLGVRYVEGGSMSLGDLVLIMGYIAQLYAPIRTLGSHVTAQQRALASAERAFAVLDEPAGVPESPGAPARGRAQGRVTFEEVSFAYEADAPVLTGVSLDVAPGRFVGVVGRSGAGKTTLINLLLRLMDPHHGRILLDGVDLRDWRLDDLRRQFAVVAQDCTLLAASIADNIAYARRGATRAEVEEAARQAGADAFIRALPQGYDTQVGERGARLSGGERQRIALARAFLKDAPLLILDEPTSAIDGTTEQAIVESIRRLARGRTVFTIAHRLSTLAEADTLLRVGGGRVVEERAAGEQTPHAPVRMAG
ncbi:ABC transporter ATP-binding protein [Ectothiorhodospiraceae bacterium 2226]|nr:ABC transporter ATP-binding protein [Ectothiorhodospiraceae bacterium 2226]